MIGYSDFVPYNSSIKEMNPREKPSQQTPYEHEFKKSREKLLQTNELVMRQNSDSKPSQRPPQQPYKLNSSGLKLSNKLGSDTNTMDFIDKLLNNNENNDDAIGSSSLNLEDFKIPEYEGIQTSLMKNTAGQGTLKSANGSQGSLEAIINRQDNRLNRIENFKLDTVEDYKDSHEPKPAIGRKEEKKSVDDLK